MQRAAKQPRKEIHARFVMSIQGKPQQGLLPAQTIYLLLIET